jgi:hypothetical protein
VDPWVVEVAGKDDEDGEDEADLEEIKGLAIGS